MEFNILQFSIGPMVLLLSGAILAGFVDALSGGGGLISIPVLLCAGLSPTQAIAANKLQGTVGALASTHYYWGKGLLDKKQLIRLCIPALCGGGLGTLSLTLLGNAVMAKILPLLLLFMALYFFLRKN